ncbi:DNA-directed primase/polymerase protein [Tachysurus fulvidraco]|uniref:DNA-directed primase/polymerase protein n=1 Tax=Tachysurus fulvidraco TaxID=1234273 RepID=UPI001FEEF157|nr:DNA-directed primase/polymerase protein [Tachysurus fulvidraco]XP_047672494.1 DNA-directed primase/polymerase protein [Tachysurus fulvidraco]
MMMRGKWQDRVKAVEQRALSYQSAPISCPYKARLSRPWQPSSIWRLFPRQSNAIAFSQCCKQDVHVFALEKESTGAGQRIYLVTSYSELWHYYSSHRQSLMHCYEVIPDGAVCKLYFDLEFDVASNKHMDGTKMVASLIQYVCVKLEKVYGLKYSARDVLNLDSSTAEKFSRHLIFILSDCAFKDNRHVGSFIHHILKPALKHLHKGSENSPENVDEASNGPQSKRMKHEDEEDLSFLIVKGKDGQKQLFVDLGVYTKNRNFRLYKSSKLGKNAAFSVAEDNEFIPVSNKHTTEEERIFLASLITNVSFTSQRILTHNAPETTSKETQRSAQCRGTHGTELAGKLQTSPYKELDDFVLKVVHKDGVQGSIRHWTYFLSEQLLVYDIGKFRWCSNVGRFHKSNNIIIIVDLKEEVWYQRCHDPECRRLNYRSSSYPLPQEVCLSYMLKEDEDDQQFLMDELGNIELSPSVETDRCSSHLQTDNTQECWDDDALYLEALDKMERTIEGKEEIPDELMIRALTECEATLV